MAAQDSITLLHISDMQFGRNHRFGNLGGDDDFDSLFGRLDPDLSELEDEGVIPQLIVVSGDLAEWGLKSEFDDARAFLEKLAERVAVPREKVVVVPGNHDVNRKLCEAYFNECEGDQVTPVEPYARKWRPYLSLFQEFYGDSSDIAFTVEEPWSLWELEDLNLVVAGLNSTIKESHEEDAHYGWVGERQLRRFEQRLKPYIERGWFRLGVVHHNVERGAAGDDENLRDADELKRIVAPSLNLLLHGHTHDGKTGWLRPTLPVISTGSAALTKGARPDEVPNQYQAIRLWPDRLERWTRRYEPGQKRWIGDTRCSDDGKAWHVSDDVAFASVHGTFRGVPAPASDARRDDARRIERARRDRGPGFADRVAEICRLRHQVAGSAIDVEVFRADGGLEYLSVRISEAGVARVFPVGVVKRGVSEEIIAAFSEEVFERYRQYDRSLRCELVYGGDRAPDDLISKAARSNVLIHSFVEFQGIIDFRGYVERQTAKLESDVVYPPHLYVPQRITVEAGTERRDSDDALKDALDWLGEPLARLVLVLGNFGAGKTFLLHELARRIPEELPHLVPILIELRSLEKASTLKQLVAQHLAGAGERHIDLDALPYMLREGRIALLFDGFDELAQRVTYKRATDHFDTLLQAAEGRAKVVVTSRTQHFESDSQVRTALLERAAAIPGLHLCRVQPFDNEQIRTFLGGLLGEPEAAARRFELIEEIRDLLGLSHNPRMLSFIANLPEEQLREARERSGAITSAELYRLLIDRWLTFEYERAQPKGSAPTLSVEERWQAATALALHVWPKLERTVHLSELRQEVSKAVGAISEKRMLDSDTAAHLVGSGTLLIRDEEGTFAFVHQSVMEWLVANHAAGELRAGSTPALLLQGEMTALMADFLSALAGYERARQWAQSALEDDDARGKANALLVLDRLGVEAQSASLAGQSLSGSSLTARSLVGADLVRADLTEARLEGADLSGADLTAAIVERADLTGASLRGARLAGLRAARAKLNGADLREAEVSGADFRLSKLVGAKLPAGGLGDSDTFGAALPGEQSPEPTVSSAAPSGALTWRCDGELLASGRTDGTAVLWDVTTGTELRQLTGHVGEVRAIAFSPDGLRLATGDDRTVRLWDPGTGAELRQFTGHEDWVRAVAFSPDGTRLASAGDDRTVRLWDPGTGAAVTQLAGHGDWVRAVAFSPDGTLLASASDDGTVRLWDSATGTELRQLTGHDDWVMGVAFSPDGTRVASVGDDGTLRLWDAVDGTEIGPPMRHSAGTRAVAFSPDGRHLASGGFDASIRLWDAATHELLRQLDGHADVLRCLAFSPDGVLASAGYDPAVRLWDPATGTPVQQLTSHQDGVEAVAFSPDGTRLASAGHDATIRLWDSGTGAQLRQFTGHQDRVRTVAFSPDGELLASAGDDATVRLWHAAAGAELLPLLGHDDRVRAVAFSPDGARLASAGDDTTVRIWDPATGGELQRLTHDQGAVRAVAFSPGGELLASAGDDATVRIWEAAGGRQIQMLSGHREAVRAVAFSPDGTRLASAGDDGTVKVWDLVTDTELQQLSGHRGAVAGVMYSPDGSRLVSAGQDGVVRVWDLVTGTELHPLVGHRGAVTSVACSLDGASVASAGDDGTVRLWDTARAVLDATLLGLAEGWALYTADGRYKVHGQIGSAFWYMIGLCRFEPGELDAFLPPGTLRRMALGEPLAARAM